MADIFAPLTIPISALDFKDKVKITIRSNAGVKCLKVPKPCEILSLSSARRPAGSVIVPKACDLRKSSPLGSSTAIQGAETMSSSTTCVRWQKPEAANVMKTTRTTTIVAASADMDSEPRLCAARVQTPSKGAEKAGTQQSHMNGTCKPEEGFQRAADDLSGTQYIKEEPLTDDEQLCDHMTPEDNTANIKEEPFPGSEDLSNIQESQVTTIKVKEEPDPEDVQTHHIKEECDSPQAGGPSTSNKIWPSAPQKDRIRHRTLPLVIRNPWLTETKMAAPKQIKTDLLRKLIELGAPSNNAQPMKTLTCTPIKMYKCSKCGRYFTNRLRLKRHYLAHKKYKVACPDCGRLFTCQATVLRHQVVHSKEKTFPCSFCDKSFTTDKGREVHQRRHSGDKPFACSDCGKHFLFKAQLKSHQMIHTGERYSCHECGRCYRTKPGLVLHMRIHSGDFLYWCPECGKGFVQKSNLKNHLHTHSKEKPFTCLQCGKGFGQKYNLKQHMNVHAAKECEKYSCPECGKSYKRKADYRWHMLIHLGEK